METSFQKIDYSKKFDECFGNLKSFIVTLLLVGSFINRDTDFIKKRKYIFITEVILCSILATIPILFMQYKRHGFQNITQKQIKSITYWFLFSVFISITSQLSGINTVIYTREKENENFTQDDFVLSGVKQTTETKTDVNTEIKQESETKTKTNIDIKQTEEKQKDNKKKEEIKEKLTDESKFLYSKKMQKGIRKSIFITVGILILLSVIKMLQSSYLNNNLDIKNYKQIFNIELHKETAIFGLFRLLPALIIMYNRNKFYNNETNIEKNILSLTFVLFYMSIVHLMFQSSGFYKKNFDW
jgi:hypothetical protein